MKNKIRIGCGAGFSGDRLDPALILAEKGGLDYLVLECLAERTIGLAQKRKLQDPLQGYDPLLERRIEALLPLLATNKVCLITNMGAANPLEGARKVAETLPVYDLSAIANPQKASAVIKEMEARMLKHASNLEFEQAAKLRDEIRKLRDAAFIS